MHSRWQTITSYWRRTVVLLSAALLIAWNFATVAHQLDVIDEHHSHHHCQMFATAQHGLAKAQPEVLVPTCRHAAQHNIDEQPCNVSEVRYTARAPPKFA